MDTKDLSYIFFGIGLYYLLKNFILEVISKLKTKNALKTKIVITTNIEPGKGRWDVVKTYDQLITLTKDDTVEFDDIEYRVDCCLLDIKENTMYILIK